MGYQPSLDGLRAVSVIAVIAYHAGAPWMTGGFFGVEVFFVVSGYLITTLLLQERERTGGTKLGQFWVRRARRLLPALFTVLLVIATWVAVFGSAEHRSDLRRDLPWSILYVNNWGQIVGSVPYFAADDPPLLRHLWSLAVEEQWYVVWPLVFVALMHLARGRRATTSCVVAVLAALVMVATAVSHGRVADNTLYLSTFTRASGLLLGSAAAFIWRPWRRPASSTVRRALVDVATDLIGWLAMCGLLVAMVAGDITSSMTYRWVLAAVSVLSVIAIGAAVSPGASSVRTALSWGPLVAVGQRSYGLYLWHWPVLVLAGAAGGGSVVRVAGALAVAAGLNEIMYRHVEQPMRSGRIRWRSWSRTKRSFTFVASSIALSMVVVLAVVYQRVEPFDAAVGDQRVEFSAPSLDQFTSVATATTPPTAAESSSVTTAPNAPPPTTVAATDSTTTAQTISTTINTKSSTTISTTISTTTSTMPTLPRRLVVVGDSQAHSFFVNLPSGLNDYFTVTDGSVDGCGVHDAGDVRSALTGFGRDFEDCAGWPERWADDAARSNAEVALVMLGAWDVFDVALGDDLYVFGTPEADQLWMANLRSGIDALTAQGTLTALLEVPCMRPVSNPGARVPPLPERGDDARVDHLNELLRSVADDRPDAWFVKGPDEWCDDPAINSDVDYRWDGVHVYQQGAGLIMSKIALSLLEIPVQNGT